MNVMSKKQRMQRLEGFARKAAQMYDMIQPGDRICVGLSGGKDSVALVLALHHLKNYFEYPFTVQALTLDPCFHGKQTDFSALTAFLEQEGVQHTVLPTNIGSLVFEERQEKNPCALCAKMRRGILHTQAKKLGCNKVALGHHLDDAVETFFMNLYTEGRIGCFSPVTWMSEKEIWVIRPLLLARESDVAKAALESGAPIIKSTCPVDGKTLRTRTKEYTREQSDKDPAFHQKILGALQKSGLDGWGPVV